MESSYDSVAGRSSGGINMFTKCLSRERERGGGGSALKLLAPLSRLPKGGLRHKAEGNLGELTDYHGAVRVL